MGQRVGLARTQALMQNLKRELEMNQSTLKGTLQQTITLSGAGATKTLTADDSGAIVFMGGSDASTLTLPAPADGLYFEVFATTALSHIVQATDDILQGNYRHNSATTTMTRVLIEDKGKITLHASGRAVGDRLQFWCDGTNWWVDGIVNNAVTLATL